jgi:DNA primase
LLLDNDGAGYKGEKRFKHIYQKYSSIKKIFIPEEYKDVDQYLRENKDNNIFKTLG